MDNTSLVLLTIAAALVLLIPCASKSESFRTLVRVDRDTIPLRRGQKYFPRKAAEADAQGPQACHNILGGGWSYASWEPAADKKAGGVYNCFRNVYQH